MKLKYISKQLILCFFAILLMTGNLLSQDLSKLFQNGKTKLEEGNWEAALNDFRALKQQALENNDILYLAFALDYEGQS